MGHGASTAGNRLLTAYPVLEPANAILGRI